MDTAVKEQVAEIVVEEAPAPNLPAVAPVKQARKPRTPAQPQEKPHSAAIARAVLAITREMEAVQKAGEHEFHKYRYPKWEDINEKLAPLLASHGLIIVQSEIGRGLLEQNDKGSVLDIVYHFTLVHESGEAWPPVEWTALQRLRDQKGVTDDKAAAKCHTQAEKFFCLKQFKIRVSDDNPDNQQHSLPKKDARDLYTRLQQDIDAARSEVELATWGRENVARKRSLPPDWQDHITARYNEKLAELRGGPRETWDDETGEVFTESAPANNAPQAPPGADAAPARQSSPAGAAPIEDESERLAAANVTLGAAASRGSFELREAWLKLPPSDRNILRAALERIHKPVALAADGASD